MEIDKKKETTKKKSELAVKTSKEKTVTVKVLETNIEDVSYDI